MKIHHTLLLILIFAISALFRFTGINWDDNAHLHPDERFLTMVVTNISWPDTLLQYFDTHTSSLNPHNNGHTFFVYGTYPLYLAKAAAQIFGRHTYDGITLVGRLLSGIADLLTVLIIFLIARRLAKNDAAGLLAAYVYAIAVLPIQQSHFFTVDPFATLFATIALYHALRGSFGIALGVATGLAISAKVSTGFILLPIAISYTSRFVKLNTSNKRIQHLAIGMMFAVSLIITIRIAYPYLFDGFTLNQRVLDNWKQLASFNDANSTFPPALQWHNVSVIQPTRDMIVFGLGLPLGVVAILSLFFRPNIIVLSWILLVLGVQSLQFSKAMRYLYPVYPAIAVLSGIFLMRLRLYRFVILSLCSLFLLWPLAFVFIYTRPHTRITATDWIYTHIPEGSTIAWESWDDPLPFARSPHIPTIYNTPALPVFDNEDEKKWRQFEDILTSANYLILSSNRGYGAIEQSKYRFPKTYRYYQLLLRGKLGFDMVAQFTSRPTLPILGMRTCIALPGFSYGSIMLPYTPCTTQGIHIVDDMVDETFTVYDHPVVSIFKKNRSINYSDVLGK